MSNFFIDLFNKITDTLFPPRLTCDLCKKEVFHGQTFCDDCAATFEPVGDGYCETCGRKHDKSVFACPSCKGWSVDKARSAFTYTGGAAKIIKRLKYDGNKYLADTMAAYMAKIYVKEFFAPDIITFVPMTGKEQFSRGFNHAEELAKSLAKHIDNRVIALLNKKFDTKNQAGLTLEERSKNLKGSFELTDKNAVKDKKILLVDDVLTTGATSGEIATLLKKHKAKSVYILTFASVVATRFSGRSDDADNK